MQVIGLQTGSSPDVHSNGDPFPSDVRSPTQGSVVKVPPLSYSPGLHSAVQVDPTPRAVHVPDVGAVVHTMVAGVPSISALPSQEFLLHRGP